MLNRSDARLYDRLIPLLRELFAAGRPIVGLCASGILIRALAPLLWTRGAEPPVVALAEDGSVAVPLLAAIAAPTRWRRVLAEAFGGIAAITTAGDLRLGFALDEPPPGWRVANPERVKPVAAALLAGGPVALVEETARADWLRGGPLRGTRTLTPPRLTARVPPSPAVRKRGRGRGPRAGEGLRVDGNR